MTLTDAAWFIFYSGIFWMALLWLFDDEEKK